MQWIPGTDNLADILTKPLNEKRLIRLVRLCGYRSISEVFGSDWKDHLEKQSIVIGTADGSEMKDLQIGVDGKMRDEASFGP